MTLGTGGLAPSAATATPLPASIPMSPAFEAALRSEALVHPNFESAVLADAEPQASLEQELRLAFGLSADAMASLSADLSVAAGEAARFVSGPGVPTAVPEPSSVVALAAAVN